MATNFEIVNRTINLPPDLTDVVVQGDTNSKTITFSLSRYFDGVDLSTRIIQIGYMNAIGETAYDDAFVNTIDIDLFTFDWIMGGGIATEAGEVSIWAEFSDSKDPLLKTYVWKTKPKNFNVEQSFTVIGSATSPSYVLQQNFYLNNNNSTTSNISDVNEPIYIDNRHILMPVLDDVVVSGDNRSQIISFQINRYYENIDLSQKTISIKFINAKNQGDRSKVVNVVVGDTTITFGWLIDGKVTVKDGYVNFAIEFLGYDENSKFQVWSTTPAQLSITKGLQVDSLVEEPDPTWLQEVVIQNDIVQQREVERISSEDERKTNETFRILSQDMIANTTQIPTFNPDETVQKMQHKDINDVVVREDVYTYDGDIITEVRTLNTGESITMTYDLSNYAVQIN